MKLLDACEFIVDCPHSSAKDEGVGIALIRTPNVGKGRLVLDNVHRVSESVYLERIARAVPTPGDLILAREAPVGNVAIIQEGQKVCLGQRVVLIRCNQSIAVPDFLVYYLLSAPIQHKLLNQSNETTVAHLNVANIRNLEIDLPPISIQRRIAAILSSLDRKIELNNKINVQLEEMAQAIFKNWFVDFEPFKDGKFVESELGRIPEGWRVGTLSELLELRKDTIKAGIDLESPYLPIDTIPMHSLVITSFRPNHEASSSLQYFEKDDIVVGAMRVYFHRVVITPCKGITRSTCFVLRPFDKETLYYALMQCNQDAAIAYAEKTSKGSTMPYAVWQGGMGNYSIIIPPLTVMSKYGAIIKSIINKMQANSMQNIQLSDLRDTLLPKLMSGEIELGPSEEEQLKIIDEMFAELEPAHKS